MAAFDDPARRYPPTRKTGAPARVLTDEDVAVASKLRQRSVGDAGGRGVSGTP